MKDVECTHGLAKESCHFKSFYTILIPLPLFINNLAWVTCDYGGMLKPISGALNDFLTNLSLNFCPSRNKINVKTREVVMPRALAIIPKDTKILMLILCL